MKKTKQPEATREYPRISRVEDENVWTYTPWGSNTKIIRVEGRIVHCPHDWVKDEKSDIRGRRICTGCGAYCVRNERKQVVEYDRNWNWGNPIPIDDTGPQPRRSA